MRRGSEEMVGAEHGQGAIDGSAIHGGAFAAAHGAEGGDIQKPFLRLENAHEDDALGGEANAACAQLIEQPAVGLRAGARSQGIASLSRCPCGGIYLQSCCNCGPWTSAREKHRSVAG